MAIPSVSPSGFVYSDPSDETSAMVDCVFSKLDLKPEDKTKYLDEICRDVNECVIPHLNYFSNSAASLIRAGKAPHIPLFMIIFCYVAGEKTRDPLPEYVVNLFDRRELDGIEYDRELIRGGEPSPFSLEAGADRHMDSFCRWSGLETISSKEEISAFFLRFELRPVKPHREKTHR